MTPRLLLWLAPAFLHAQSYADVLARGRIRIQETLARLPRYMCTQTIDRSYFSPPARILRSLSCDDILSMRQPSSLKLTGTDRLRLDVMVTDEGLEVYSWPEDRTLSNERSQSLAGGGPLSGGTFGSFLGNIFASEDILYVPEGEQLLNGRNALQFRYRVSLKASHYKVVVKNLVRTVAFDGRFWLDPVSAELLRLTVRTAQLAPATDNCEASTTTDFARLLVGSGRYLLPTRSVFRTVRRDGVETENITDFADCREFHGETAIHFEGGFQPAASPVTSPKPDPPFPAAIPVSLSFVSAIDTARAAAGDRIEAVLQEPAIFAKKGTTLAPAGTRVRGRVTAMRHQLTNAPYFAISVEWDGIERDGRWMPFAARLDAPAAVLDRRVTSHSEIRTSTQPRREPGRGDTLVFPADTPSITIPAGYQTRWITFTRR